jgi:lipid II:glycine glycyltransferase (peptidoglycan interpeptide bridge formation enzyme)
MNQQTLQKDFLQQYSPDGGFLQSEEWRKFQEAAGKPTFHFEAEGFWANVIEHVLPLAGKYWYVPRGPVAAINNQQSTVNVGIRQLVASAEKVRVGWIRIEPADEAVLDEIRKTLSFSLKKAPHDMQPKEVLVMDISSEEEALLARMKPKARYNIRLAEKKGVNIFTSREEKHLEAFLNLVEVTARRDGIVSHPREYYRKMFEILPESMLRLYVAEHDGDILAANLVLFFGQYATYLHGASGNEKRSLMAPYLLQWRQVRDAKALGCVRYDFGGVNTESDQNSWAGITRFKSGFAPGTGPVRFPGAYDVVLDGRRYARYRFLQQMKKFLTEIKKTLKKF